MNPAAVQTANATGSANGTGWVLLNCSGPAAAAFQPSSAYQVASYPEWSTIAKNTNLH
jgi:hypothetical protein